MKRYQSLNKKILHTTLTGPRSKYTICPWKFTHSKAIELLEGDRIRARTVARNKHEIEKNKVKINTRRVYYINIYTPSSKGSKLRIWRVISFDARAFFFARVLCKYYIQYIHVYPIRWVRDFWTRFNFRQAILQRICMLYWHVRAYVTCKTLLCARQYNNY